MAVIKKPEEKELDCWVYGIISVLNQLCWFMVASAKGFLCCKGHQQIGDFVKYSPTHQTLHPMYQAFVEHSWAFLQQFWILFRSFSGCLFLVGHILLDMFLCLLCFVQVKPFSGYDRCLVIAGHVISRWLLYSMQLCFF